MEERADDRDDELSAESPTEVLTREHEIIALALVAMRREAARIRHARQLDAEAVERMVTFTRQFTDGSHHEKEERLLFPLVQRLDEETVHTLDVMRREHGGATIRMNAVAEALDAARAGDDVARRTVAANLAGYVQIVAAHIVRENKLVFPLADDALDAEARRDLLREFAEIDARYGPDAHARFHAMAHELARREAGGGGREKRSDAA